MTRPVPDAKTRSEPLITGMPLTPSTGSSASPASSLFKDSCPKPNPESGPFIKSGGFFGPTNFSAVFLENRENLGNDDIQISNDSEPYVASYESLQSQTFLMLAGKEPRGSPRIALGAKVLNALPDQHTCRFLLGWYLEKNHECSFPKEALIALANSLWTTYSRQLAEPRRPEELEAVSSILCKTAETALEEFEDYDRFFVACSGANLRWEVLGMVFAALTTAVLSLPERDPFFSSQRGDRRSRRNFSIELKDCVQACITLSNYMDLINIPMVALLLKNLILQTVISGDVSLVVWRQLGDLVSATTALGLHRLADKQPITFVSEIKKRIFNATFICDMGSSLLTGRPPSLNYRFARLQLPADVCDGVLMRGGEDLQRALDALDSNGWNRDGDIYTNTSVRTRTLLAPILNQSLELFLGDPQHIDGDAIKHLMSRIEQTFNSFPNFLKFNMADVSNPDVSDSKVWHRLCLRLMMLEHRLLLERLAFKQDILDGQSMVDCAREMLELTVLIWAQRDRFIEHHHDYDWMLMCWGIPSSGVLCVELLKQTKQPQGTQHMLRIPRSEIVQNLSLLIGFLEWIKPSAGNYQLCGRMRQIIKRILDQIINPSPPSSAPTSSQEEGTNGVGNGFEAGNGMGGPYDPMLDVGFDDGLDNLEWLNTVDWSRGPWVDLQDFSAAKWV